MFYRSLAAVFFAVSLQACTEPGDHDHDHDHDDNENEVITTLELTFTNASGEDLVFSWADPENTGDPVIDDIELPAGEYTTTLKFLNELEEPAEDITVEIKDEDDQHQIFFTGDAVEGPANTGNEGAPLLQAYDDEDENGLPVGLTNTFTATAGTGDLTVTLRHMPPESGEAVKVEGAAGIVSDEGFSGIGGDNDIQVTLPVTVE